ncbi:myotubularin-related protein 13 isoform X1 [Hydra vulgaris]|uniref:myotubularin-related protein 13 isoform X1 n=1 Tax=Hydra vulgaris TaxID=6087 RepID=UPI001F5F73F8|nr:myotubularin-related protein 13 [Hydra vulgaris]
MSRLADYFCVVGVEDVSDNLINKKVELKSSIIQRFPCKDWKDVPFPQGLEHFCQPGGWFSSVKNLPPTFYVAILTDIEGKSNYLACLTFYEGISVDTSSDHLTDKICYIPKCLCLVSRNKYFNTLKNCLLTILAGFLNGKSEILEKMIGCMLGFVHVPPPGGPKLMFSIGGGDSQVLQPPLSKDLPSTHESVAVLFNQLGINSMLKIFTALVTEAKILLLASSYSHLTMAAEALVSLLYPLQFSYVFIPTLPSSLLDFLTAPTPFLMGVHMSYKGLIPELFDVVVVNIDEGYVTVPESIHLTYISEPYYSNILKLLKMILTPSLFTSDLLFPVPDSPQTLALQDKELRAVFIKLFAEMFCGYRSCLTLIRVHPKPIISFNKMAFMEKRGLVGDDFFSKVLDSVSFSTMTQARGPPYRVVDMFDELLATVTPSDKEKSTEELLAELIPIVDHLCENEPWFDNPEISTIPSINVDMFNHPLKRFPLLNEVKINSYLVQSNESVQGKVFKAPVITPKQVPISTYDLPVTHFINQRRLEVIKDCVQYIYESKISEARKAMPSVLRALKSKGAQLALCNELELRIKNEKSAILEHDQYNLIIRLIDAALKEANTVYNTNVAAKVIPIVSAFHRKLGSSAIQFAYTSVQEHAVWSNMQFWEEAFYAEVQRQIVQLHVNERLSALKKEKKDKAESNNFLQTQDMDSLNVADGKNQRNSMFFAPSVNTPNTRIRAFTRNKDFSQNLGDSAQTTDSNETIKSDLPNPMNLAAELLSEWDTKSEEEKERLVYAEESIVYSITMLFAQQMMYLRVPTNACVEMRKLNAQKKKEYEKRLQQALDKNDGVSIMNDDNLSMSLKPSSSIVDGSSTYIGGSIMESGSIASANDWTDIMDFGESVKDTTSKFILRFVERVCIEAGVTAAHLKSLQTNIPMLVGMHIESLEEVYRETKDAPMQKAKIMKPTLLVGENLQFDGIRCLLIADGRELGVRDTNKQTVVEKIEDDREMNIGADNGGPCLLPADGALFLTNYRVIFKGTPLDQFASEMTVTRSFPIGALIKEKKVNGMFNIANQNYDSYLQIRSITFQVLKLAFDEEVFPDVIENLRKSLVKARWPTTVYSTFAFNLKEKPTLQRTLSQRQHSIRKANKSINTLVTVKNIVSINSKKGKTKLAQTGDTTARKYQAVKADDEDNDDMKQVLFEQENRGADRLKESVVYKDYERLGLGCITKASPSQWRLSMINFHYNVCRSYPAVVVVPSRVVDDTIMKVSKNHRLNRFPVVVWSHKRTKGALLRSGSISKSVLTSVLKGSLNTNQVSNYNSSNISEDEKMFSEIVKATQMRIAKGKVSSISAGAALSMMAMSDDFASLFEGSQQYKKLTEEQAEINSWTPANLYIFTDKSSKISVKMESSSKIVVVNVDIHDVGQVKTSFAKLLKVCCPSNSSIEKTFFSALEESKWMSQISSLLQLACSILTLIDVQGSSCLITLGDGSEVTAQLVSLVQILSDPFYRTIKGFKVLIEKDWLAFGYRFSHRGNHTFPAQPTVAPFFLQFLDCVHQVVIQFPHAFEFNIYFLKFLAYHHTSMRFNTFFLDSEHERYQHGWFPDSDVRLNEEHTQKLISSLGNVSRARKDAAILKAELLAEQQAEQKKKKNASMSLWDYLDIQSEKLTLFHQFSYHPELSKGVLQPFCNISNLEIWDYYIAENLYTGPTYDPEIISDFDMGTSINEVGVDTNTSNDVDREDSQRCVTGCYGTTKDFPRDECSYLLNELSRLAEELDQSTQKWQNVWMKIDIKEILHKQQRSHNWSLFWTRERRIAMHKRATLDMVLKGKLTDNVQIRSEFGLDFPHQFQYHNYILSSICNYCLQTISGLHGGMQCVQCFYNVHEKCQSMVPTACPKHPSLIDQPVADMSISSHSLPGNERVISRNFKGTLYKKGRRIRQWKSRWFVLDAERNHLTYYLSEEDTQLQGYINLGEMRGCRITGTLPAGSPKWADGRCCIELVTTKRDHFFLAHSHETAQEWVERLNALNA